MLVWLHVPASLDLIPGLILHSRAGKGDIWACEDAVPDWISPGVFGQNGFRQDNRCIPERFE